MRKILSLLLAAVLLLLALAGCSQAQKEEPLPEALKSNSSTTSPAVPATTKSTIFTTCSTPSWRT